jgi:hypothetical protein
MKQRVTSCAVQKSYTYMTAAATDGISRVGRRLAIYYCDT